MIAALFAILEDAFFAALAGLGFAVAANPPKRILPAAAFLAALGHAFRFAIMEYGDVKIATASLLAGLVVGFAGIIITIAMRVPSEFFCFPALLPMIPGLYAYKAILSLINFMEADNMEVKHHWFVLAADNGFTSLFVVCALGIGAIIPIMLFRRGPFLSTYLNRIFAASGR